MLRQKRTENEKLKNETLIFNVENPNREKSRGLHYLQTNHYKRGGTIRTQKQWPWDFLRSSDGYRVTHSLSLSSKLQRQLFCVNIQLIMIKYILKFALVVYIVKQLFGYLQVQPTKGHIWTIYKYSLLNRLYNWFSILILCFHPIRLVLFFPSEETCFPNTHPRNRKHSGRYKYRVIGRVKGEIILLGKKWKREGEWVIYQQSIGTCICMYL